MQPFENIKMKEPPSGFAPKSCMFTPQKDGPGSSVVLRTGTHTGARTTSPQRRVLSPPAVGAPGKAVQLKKIQQGGTSGGGAGATTRWGSTVPDVGPPSTQSPKQPRPVLLPENSVRVKAGSGAAKGGYSSPTAGSPGRPTSPFGGTGGGGGLSSPGAFKSPRYHDSALSPTRYPVQPASLPLPAAVQHPNGIAVADLTPSSKAVLNLKALALDDTLPCLDDTQPLTPRFKVSSAVEVKQGAGPQAMEAFAVNLDANEAGRDQALCYNVWAHSTEVFADGGLPVIGCDGTLFFTPSYHLGGSSLVTVTLSDNAAVFEGKIRTSEPVVTKVTVLPGAVHVKKAKDWRSQTSRQKMAVVVLPDGGEAAEEPDAVEQRIFPPWNIHKLRERTKIEAREEHGVRALVPSLLECLRSHARAFFGERFLFNGGEETQHHDATAENEAALLAKLGGEGGGGGGSIDEALPVLASLAKLRYTAGSQGHDRCRATLRDVVRLLGEDAGIVEGDAEEAGDLADKVTQSRSVSVDDFDEQTHKQDRYAMALLDLANFYIHTKKPQAALPLARKAVSALEGCHGADHKSTLGGQVVLAEVLSALFRHSEAFEVCDKMLCSAQLVYQRMDTGYARALHLWAYCALRCVDLSSQEAQAIDRHEAAHRIVAQSSPAPDAQLMESHIFMCGAHRAVGDFDASVSACNEAVRLITSTPSVSPKLLVFKPFLEQLAAFSSLLKEGNAAKYSGEAAEGAGGAQVPGCSLEEAFPAQCPDDALFFACRGVGSFQRLIGAHGDVEELNRAVLKQTLRHDVLCAKALRCSLRMCGLAGGDGGAMLGQSPSAEPSKAAAEALVILDDATPALQTHAEEALAMCAAAAGFPSEAGGVAAHGGDGGVRHTRLAELMAHEMPEADTLRRVAAALVAAQLSRVRWLNVKERRVRRELVAQAARLIGEVVRGNEVSGKEECPMFAACYELLAVVQDEQGGAEDALVSLERAMMSLDKGRNEVVGCPAASGVAARIFDMRVEMVQKAGSLLPASFLAQYTERSAETLAARGEWHQQNVNPLLNLAEICYLEGQYEHAHRHFAKALAIVDGQNMHFLLGNLFKPATQLRPMEVQERNRLASERMSPAQCMQLGMILSQVAAVHEKQGAYREAETSFMQTLASFEIAGQPTHIGVCYALDGLARLLYLQGFHGDALAYFDKSREIRYRFHRHAKEEIAHSQKNMQIVEAKVCVARSLLATHGTRSLLAFLFFFFTRCPPPPRPHPSQMRQNGYQLVKHCAPSRFPVYY